MSGGEIVGQTASGDRLGLERVADHPHLPVRAGRHGGQESVGFPGGQLRELVADDHGPIGQMRTLQGEPGHGHGRQAGLAELDDGLVGGRHRQHDPAGRLHRRHRSGQGGGLAVPGRGGQHAQGRAGPAQGPDGPGLVVAQTRATSDGRLHHFRRHAHGGAPGDDVQAVEEAVLNQAVGPGAVGGRGPPRRLPVDQANHQIRTAGSVGPGR